MLTLFILAVETANMIARSTAEAFSDLYREYMPKVYRYISYRITDTQQAEDLTSVVFEKALTKFKTYSSEKASFSTWVFSIARNTVIDHFRVRGKEQLVRVETMSDANNQQSSTEDEVIRSEEQRILQSCIAQLAPQEREVITLKFGAEMTNREIARITGLSESNVGVIVYRSVRKLRDSFDRGQVNG